MTKKDMMSKDWWAETGIRAIRTVAQAGLSMLSVGQAVTDTDLIGIVSVSLTSGIISVLTSVAFGHNKKKED